MQILRLASAVVLLALAGCAGASPRPTSLRELPNSDINSCAAKARERGAGRLQGTLNLYVLVDEDGAVSAAFVHDSEGLDFAQFRNCATFAATNAKFPGEGEDYLRGFSLTCPPDSVECGKQPLTSLPRQPLDEKLAQDSLTFAGWATSTDKGWGYSSTRQYAQALAAFDEALKANPNDLRALRGKAQALAESGTDLKAARELAEKAVAQQSSAATLEAQVRVCLKQGDDECAVKSFIAASKAADVRIRSFDLAELNDAAKAANERLSSEEEGKQAAAKKAAEAKLARQDPEGCSRMEGAAKAVCYTRRCFAAGGDAYALDLRKALGKAYAPGQWSASGDEAGGYVVTLPLRPAGAGAAKKGKAAAGGDASQDARWRVKLGDGAQMVAMTQSASVISRQHNACK